MTSEYTVALVAVKVPLVPPVTVISFVSNSVTSSVNVKVAVSSAVELILDGRPVIVTSGVASSQTAVTVSGSAGPVFKPSVAVFAPTVTTTSADPFGVIRSL